MEKEFELANVIKVFGQINKAIYGVNPYEKKYPDAFISGQEEQTNEL